MFKRYRLLFIAIGGIAFSCFAGIAQGDLTCDIVGRSSECSGYGSDDDYQQRQRQNSPQKSDAETDYFIAYCAPPPLLRCPVFISETVKEPPESPGDDDKDRDGFLAWLKEWGDLISQIIMAAGTIGILYFTGLGLRYIIRTHKASKLTLLHTGRAAVATKKQAEIAKTIGEKQIKIAEKNATEQLETAQTAQASLVVVKKITATFNSRIKGEAAKLEFHNIGKSAAFNIRFATSIFLGDMADILVSPYIAKPNTWNNFLHSDETKSCWFGFDRKQLLSSFTPSQHFSAHEPYVFVAGAILWRDVFHKWRGARFCYYSNFASIGPFNTFVPAMAGNEVLEDWQIEALLDPFYKVQTLRFRDNPELKP